MEKAAVEKAAIQVQRSWILEMDLEYALSNTIMTIMDYLNNKASIQIK